MEGENVPLGFGVDQNIKLTNGIYTKVEDGLTYEYESSKKGWFPVLEEVFDQQQSIYKVDGVDESEPAFDPALKKKEKRKLDHHPDETAKKKPKKINTSVYVTNLPTDCTVEEIHDYFKKCGIILEDTHTGLPKIKIYQDEEGRNKGDALVVYFKEESVKMACSLLDDTLFRFGEKPIKVQEAVFQEKEKTEEEKKEAKVDKNRIRKKMHKLTKKLDWEGDEIDEEEIKNSKNAKIVILKHMFSLEELEEDPTLLLDLKEDIREEAEKLGEVTNIVLYDKNPDGVISVRYKDAASALACVKNMNGRWFSKRKIEASIYDGKLKYEKTISSLENEEEEELRLKKYEEWLQNQN
ncbi:hypothetical protein HK099_002115 [Clydaea vesicula]|uniref:RRM domain-containing protein n=1 Tax=Clydaea vesicula TaxID=447962 RepID=A0AAD5Y0Y9_9FUNG|nr:hypothetical protein HK099_002115 [Clydaea vesicula]